MTLLILGLLLFLGTHSVRIFADDWRTARVQAMGLNAWKGLYSLIALVGFVLIVMGYGETRGMADLWSPPLWTRHVTVLLTLPIFVLLVAAYLPGTHIKAKFGHPMAAAVKLWAFAHLISNGGPGDVLLFGAFLVWSIFDYRASRRRDRAAGTRYPAVSWSRDVLATAIGLVGWIWFAKWGHAWLIGVAPLG